MTRDNGSCSSFWLLVLRISVIVRIIITGFKDFGLVMVFGFVPV